MNAYHRPLESEEAPWMTPPGMYWLRVQVRLHRGRGAPLTTTPAAPLTQVTVVPRDQDGERKSHAGGA